MASLRSTRPQPSLAERSGLTAYDASYIWLAPWTGSELVTLERQLAQAGATDA